MVIIKRAKEAELMQKLGNWVYVCGRRKTGKTFFIKNFTKWDEYFFVRKDKAIFDKENKEISYQTFFELFRELIKNKAIVIDEFHRLPAEFFDYLHALGKKGKLTVISSTLWLSKKLLGKGSPLLGLFSLLTFGLADERDVINSLKNKIKNNKDLIETSVYLREPILATDYAPPLKNFLSAFLYSNRLAINEIIGEIFDEEERQISLVYEGIMRAIADGKTKSTEISSYLFSKKLTPKDNPGLIQRYLDVLVKIGILEKLEVFGKKKFVYKNISPLFDLHYYLDEKYGYIENLIPEEFIKKVIDKKIPMHVESFFRDLLSKCFGLKKVIIEKPEIDIALTDFKKLKVVAEVKWKKGLSEEELKSIEEKLNEFECKKFLILPTRKALKRKLKDITVLDVEDVINLSNNPKVLEAYLGD
jgi:hypothetical protein